MFPRGVHNALYFIKIWSKDVHIGKKRENPLASDYNFPKLVCKPHKEMIYYTLPRKNLLCPINRNKLKWIIGTHGNWKNQNPGGRFGAPS